MRLIASLAALALSGCGPSELAKQTATSQFCSAPTPLSWAPTTKGLALYTKETHPAKAEAAWIPDLRSYYLPPELASKEPLPGWIACLVIDNEVLETRTYADSKTGKPRAFERTRARTTLRVYEAKTARLLVEDRATGTDPREFESSVSDIVRYRGNADLPSIHEALRRLRN